jgi:glyoxylase I family protein
MNAVHHIALNCRDRVTSEEFYTRHFGFRRARVLNAGQPDEFVMLRLGSTCMELFQGSRDASGHAGEQTIGFKHLAFEVPDIESAIVRLRSDGVSPDPIIDCSKAVPGLRICFFKDPDENIVELMEGWTDSNEA